MNTTPEIARWQEAEQHRDQLQAQLERLDAQENAGLVEDQQKADQHRERAGLRN